VVRAWSNALNADDNEHAADLFAPGARVVQAGSVIELKTHRLAVAWNAALPCSGKIVSLESDGPVVTATFLLGDRATSRCDGPGDKASAAFEVEHGKIVVWHQLPTSSAQSAQAA
jgi:hypothetical protein